MLGFLLLIATACFWMAARGVESGQIRLPLKHTAGGSVVFRTEKPALFWTSLGTLAAVGVTSAGFAIWLVAARRAAQNAHSN